MIEVKEVGDKWGVFLKGVLLGTSKARFDADHAKQVLTHWCDECVTIARRETERTTMQFPRGEGG